MENKFTAVFESLTFKDLFEELSEEKSLARIRREVKETTKEVEVKRKGQERKETRRGRSQYVLDSIHTVLKRGEHLDCKNAEGPCLNALIEKHMPKKVYKTVIDSLVLVLPALYTKMSVLGNMLSMLSKT